MNGSARILIAAPRVWDGGMELHISKLALLAAGHGHSVTLAVHPRFPEHAGRRAALEQSPVQFVRLPQSESPVARLWRQRTALAGALPAGSFDLVLLEGFGESLPWYRRFVARTGRLIWHEHTDGAYAGIVEPGFHKPASRRYPWMFRRMFRHLAAAIAGSERARVNLKSIQGLPCPVRVIPPLPAFDEAPNVYERFVQGRQIRIGVFGTLHPAKGTGALLRLWPHLEIPDAELHFHGPLAMPPPARMPGVVFHGPYRIDELPTLMRDTDLAVVPSLHEGYPLTAWECMAHGVPFVIADVGAAPELARDNPHVRCAALDDTAMKQAIEAHVKALLDGRLSRVALQRHQRRIFSAGEIEEKYLNLISRS